MADLTGFDDNRVGFDELITDESSVSFDNFATNNETIARGQRLEQAKKDKLRRLSQLNQNASLDNSYTDLGDGRLESNKNKIWNDLNDQEYQSLMQYALGKYTLNRNAQGNYAQEDGDTYIGRARRLYLFGTNSSGEEVKFGLARGDVQGAEERYTSTGRPGEYGWAPGEYGVNVEDKQLDVLLPNSVAVMLEGLGHGRKSALANRVVQDRYGDPELADKYGSGASEYYTSKEGLFGAPAEIDLELGKKLFTQYMADMQERKPYKGTIDTAVGAENLRRNLLQFEAKNADIVDRGINTLSGFASSFVDSLFVSPLDAVGDLTGLYDLGKAEDNTKAVQDFFGYNPIQAENAISRIGKEWETFTSEDATLGERLKAAGNGILEAFITPEMWGTSMGMLLSWVTPGVALKFLGVGSKFASVISKIDRAADLGQITKGAARLQKAEAYMSIAGAKDILINQSGHLVSAMGQVNNQYETFVENNNGRELEGAEKAAWFAERFAVQLINQNIDKLTDYSLIKSNKNFIASAIPAVKAMTNKEFAAAAKTMAKGAGLTLTNMGKEAAQEYSQTMMELYNARYGSEAFSDVEDRLSFIMDKRNIDEAGVAALAGAGGAPQFEAIGAAGKAISGSLGLMSKGAGKVGEKVKSKGTSAEIEEELPTIDPEATDEEVSAATAEADKAASKTAFKYVSMFSEPEAMAIFQSEDLADEEAVETPSFDEALDNSNMSFADIIAEIEAAEVVIEDRQTTSRKQEGDDLSLSMLRKAKARASQKIMEGNNNIALGSGFSPEDVVETFIESKIVDGTLEITEDEKALVNEFLKQNGQKPYRFEAIQAKLEGKDAVAVYEDSQGTAQNSAPSRRARLKRLVNTPGVNKALVEKELKGIQNFLNTQLDRKKEYEVVLKEVKADIARYNNAKNDAAKAVPPKSRDFGDGKFINVKKGADGKYYIHEQSQAVIGSIDDTIDHLQTTLARYKKATVKILGEEASSDTYIDVPASTQVNKNVQVSREKHKKFYDKRKPTKAIVDKDTSPKWWVTGGDYASLNESKLANSATEFSSDDTVLLTTITIKPGSVASKTLKKAIQAGATIILDEPLSKQGQSKEVRTLARKYGAGVVNVDGVVKWRPAEEADAILAEQETTAKAKKRKDAIVKRMVDAFDKAFTTKAEGKKLSTKDKKELNQAIEAAKEFFVKDDVPVKQAVKNMRKHARSVIAEEAKELEPILKKLMKTEGTSSKAYSEAVGKYTKSAIRLVDKNIKEEEARLAKGGKLVTEWRDAEAEAKKGGKPLVEWIKETFGKNARAIGINMIKDSAGKARAPEKVVYSYKVKGKNEYKTTTNLNDVKNLAEDGVYHIIEVDPENYVQVSEPTLLNTLNVEELKLEGEDNVLFNDFVETAVGNLKETLAALKLGDTFLPFPLIDSPAASLIFNADGELNANFAVAARIALYTFVKNNAYLMAKERKTEKDIAELLGRHESELSQKAIFAMQDKGLMFKTATDSVGKDIAKLLGLTAKESENIDSQLFTALTAEFGQIALLMGMQKEEGILEKQTMDSKQFAEDVLGKKGIKPSEAVVNFIGIKNTDKLDDVTFVTDALANVLPNIDVRRKEPSFVPFTDEQKNKATGRVKKEKLGVNIADESAKAMETLMDTEVVADMPLLRFAISEKNKPRIMKLLGWVELDSDEFNALSFKEKETQASKNRDIERNFQHLEWLNNSVGAKENKVSMWFKYFFSKNGRFFIDSNTVNPQTNKHLDRFFMQPAEHNNVYAYDKKTNTFKVDGDDITFNVMYALAQGFGLSTDKKANSTIKSFSTTILKTLNTRAKLDKAREEFLNTGKVVVTTKKDSKGNVVPDVEIEIEHLGHALQAFDFIEKMLDNPGKFESSITAEFDAVTSGFALKLLQMPIIGEKLYDWLGKVGILLKNNENITKLGQEGLSMNNLLDLKSITKGKENFLDSYQFLAKSIKDTNYETLQENSEGNSLLKAEEGYAKELWEAVSKVLPTVDPEGGISSDLRNLFKYPFMTFNYASSIKSIRSRLKVTMQDDIAKRIAKIDFNDIKDEKQQAVVDMLKAYAQTDDVKVLEKLQEDVRKKDLKFVKTGKGASLGTYLDVMIDASYGVQVENVLTEEFSPFVAAQDAINGSFRAMFEVFKVAFEEELLKARQEGPVSAAKERKIYNKLLNKWPAIKGPLSRMEEEFSSDGTIGVYTTETASPYGVYAGRKAAVTKVSPEMKGLLGDRATIRTTHMIKTLGAAISAGSVIPIHYIDGAVMGMSVLAMKGGMTSIHDAIMPNLLRMGEAQQSYNKAVIEVSASYSFINEIVKSLDRIIEGTKLFSDEGKTAYQKASVKIDYKTTTNAASYIIEARNNMAAIANKSNASRKELFKALNEGAHVMHMAGSTDGVFTLGDKSQVEYVEIDRYEQIKDNNTTVEVDGMTEKDLNDLAKNLCLF